MEQNPQTTPPQVNLNLHKQRLYSLIAAGVALVSLILPWVSINLGMFGGSYSVNGFHGWGYLSLIGVGGVAAASFMGIRTLPYDANLKNIALGGFGAIALGALIFFIRLSSNGAGSATGFGLWLCLLAGLAGLAFLLGFIKIPEKK